MTTGFTSFETTEKLDSSRLKLLENDKNALTWNADTAFPTGGVSDGMPAYRTDEGKLYMRKGNAWVEVVNFSDMPLTQKNASSTYLTIEKAEADFLSKDDAAENYLAKTGGTLTGALDLGGNHLNGVNYLYANWYHFGGSIASQTAATEILIKQGGWIYSRTPAQLLSDIGALSAKTAQTTYLGIDAKAKSATQADSATNATNATNATTAAKLGSENVGSASAPIYLNKGVPTACDEVFSKSDIIYSNEDLVAGESELPSGTLYFVYE